MKQKIALKRRQFRPEKSDATLQDVDENILALDTFLYTQLLAWLEGEQLETLLRGPENCGFEAWRSLVRAQERLEPTRKVMQLEKLLHPQFGDRMTWRREWLSWEAECLRHAVLLGGVLTGDVKISIVRQRAPADLRQHLMLTAKDYGGDYEIFRQRIDEYWRAVGPQDAHEQHEEIEFVDHQEGKERRSIPERSRLQGHEQGQCWQLRWQWKRFPWTAAVLSLWIERSPCEAVP